MSGKPRKPASRAEVRLGDNAGRFQTRRQPALAVGSAMTIFAISTMAFAPDHAQVLTTSYSQAASASRRLCGHAYKLPEPIAPALYFHDPRSKGVRGLAYCRNGSFLAAADGNGHVYIWSMAAHKIAAVLADPHSRGVSAVAYRPKSTSLAAGDANGSVYIWQPGRARPRRLRDSASKGVRGIAFSPDGRLLAAADGNGHAYIWSMATERIVAILRDAGSRGINSVTFSTNGGLTAVTGDANGEAFVWALSRTLKGRYRVTLQAQLHDPKSKGVEVVAFMPKSRTLATADRNGATYLWTPGGVGPRALADPITRGVDAESFTPNGKFLVSGDADGHLFFWALSTYQVVELLPAHSAGAIHAVAFSPNGRRIAAGTATGRIYVADTSLIGIDAEIG